MDQDFTATITEIINGPLGTDAVLKTSSGNKIIRVVFHNSYITNRITNIEWEASEPFADCLGTDVSHVKQNDTIVIKNSTYRIEVRQPLDDGWTRLILSNA